MRSSKSGLTPHRRTASEETDESFEDAIPAQPPGPQEYWLIKLLLANDELVSWAAAHLNPEWVQHPLIRGIVEQRIEAHTRQTWTSLGAFVADLATPEMRNLVTEAVTEARTIPNPAQQLAGVLQTLRNQALDRESTALRLQLSQPDLPGEQLREINQRLNDLRAAKRLPISPAGG